MSDLDLMLRFMLQVLVVLAACGAIGWLGRRYMMQAQVTMEMIVGVMLGPSLLGMFFPKLQQYLFPQFLHGADPTSGKHPSMSILYVVAQIGLVLYMFLIGLEFNTKLISTRIKGAVGVSVAGILFPFALGVLICYGVLQGRSDLFGPGISPANQALYLGAAMSITAFPMLARIIYEAGIANTSLGTLALGAGATDDAAAWTLLAIVLATAKGKISIAAWAILGGLGFVALMLTIGKKALAPLGKIVEKEGKLSQRVLVTVLLILFAGAWYTDAVGIYAVFGAFVIGAAMPRGKFAVEVRHKLESVTVGLFLPFFFVYSGLNTHLGSLNTPALWAIGGLILFAAILGKFGGCYAAARLTGESHRESMAIGTLMNSRGLMELIILNIGLQQKVITVQLFTIMILMAIVTTVMAAPLFERIYHNRAGALPTGAVAAG
ncbi:MAG TPA: cation:proton antiporter [Fimbriimonadaceae bacterium]|nr:cation:proton antiporter [Fimbriimonadaceae bacterium]